MTFDEIYSTIKHYRSSMPSDDFIYRSWLEDALDDLESMIVTLEKESTADVPQCEVLDTPARSRYRQIRSGMKL